MLLQLLLASLVAAPVDAARIVRYNEVTISSSDLDSGFAEAMRAALVRATGRRDADQDPAFSDLLADPRRYVQQYRPVPGGGLTVSFDAAALERAITASGRSFWPKERPVVFVAIAALPAGSDPVALRRALEDAATARGLPLQFPESGAAGGVALAYAPGGAALAAARRLGADVLLAGRGADDGSWSWTLDAGGGEETFGGALTAGVHGAADVIARSSDSVMSQVEVETVVHVGGLRSLRDYAAASRLLAAAPGVRAVAPVEVTAEAVVFRVVARGGSDGLSIALANSGALRPAAPVAGRLAFDYAP